MKITMESTTQMVAIETGNGGRLQARVWKGVTEGGVECQVLVPRIAVHKADDNSAFEQELREAQHEPMTGPRAFDLRFFID
jgi:hypothetical protein